jgi:hypothetical protein
MIGVRLEWPTEITETDFFRRVRELPERGPTPSCHSGLLPTSTGCATPEPVGSYPPPRRTPSDAPSAELAEQTVRRSV